MTTSSAALQLLFSPTLQYANDVFRVIFEQTGNGTGTRTKLASTIFKARKRSCGKVMFLHLSVNHSVHGGSPRQRPPPLDRPPPCTVKSERYPSFWNEFLYIKVFTLQLELWLYPYIGIRLFPVPFPVPVPFKLCLIKPLPWKAPPPKKNHQRSG